MLKKNVNLIELVEDAIKNEEDTLNKLEAIRIKLSIGAEQLDATERGFLEQYLTN